MKIWKEDCWLVPNKSVGSALNACFDRNTNKEKVSLQVTLYSDQYIGKVIDQ